MEYGPDVTPGNARRAKLLGDLVQGRAMVAGLLADGQYEEASQEAHQLLERLSGHFQEEQNAETEVALLPHLTQGMGLLADMSFAAMATGNNAGAAELLRFFTRSSEGTGELLERLTSLGITYCKDGRPSLDGGCLRMPPCKP